MIEKTPLDFVLSIKHSAMDNKNQTLVDKCDKVLDKVLDQLCKKLTGENSK